MMRLLRVVPVLLLLTPASPAATPGGWQTYRDAARGVAVSFPGDWKPNPGYYDDDYPTSDEPPPRIHALAISPTGDLQPGTTLNSASVHVAIVPLPSFRDECAAWSFIATSPPDFNSAFDVDTPDYAHVVGSDPGGWYTYEDFVWRISTAPCVGVHYTISYHAADSDQAKSEKPFDRAKLLALLDAIRATVVLTPAHRAGR